MFKKIAKYFYSTLNKSLKYLFFRKRVSFHELILVHRQESPEEVFVYVRKITASVYKKAISANFIEKSECLYESCSEDYSLGEYVKKIFLKEEKDLYYERGRGNLAKKRYIKVKSKIFSIIQNKPHKHPYYL